MPTSGAGDLVERRATISTIDAADLHALYRLRVDVFVVEQECPYPEIDDLDETAEHRWLEASDRPPLHPPAACVRIIDTGEHRRIGRVATRSDMRGQGLAGRLITSVLADTAGPWVLDAQSHLRDYYASFGFAVVGEEFLEDGIPHLPMRRER